MVGMDPEIELVSFHVSDTGGKGQIVVRLVTPMLAPLYTEDLEPQVSAVQFDRAADGEIIIPGRWWQWVF